MSALTPLWIDSTDASVIERGHALATRLGLLARTTMPTPASGCLLHLDADGLSLRDASAPATPGLDAAPPAVDVRPGSRDRSRRQPLGRAMGGADLVVADATAGFGRDAVMLAIMGHRVVTIERVAVLAALVEDGWARAAASTSAWATVLASIERRVGDARDVLPSLAPRPDVVYLDPMYPPKRKTSALPPRRVQLARLLVGDDPDAASLLAVARRVARRRVVVKRPHHAPPLAEESAGTAAVTGSITSKLVRYDLYHPASAAT